ncbi:MAG: hypothetical protein EOP14_06020 [Pseudomonas sp.]|nr:MAG: hypothetical protein EOP14_06020 [Pseudomonas sp.]
MLFSEYFACMAIMASSFGIHVLTDEQCVELELLIDEVRPHSKVPHTNLRQTIEVVFWRHQNGVRWHSPSNDI